MKQWQKIAVAVIMAPLAFVALVGCGTQRAAANNGVLRQIEPGSVVYIDGWNQRGDQGDKALVEQKPSGLWVIPKDAPIRYQRTGDFNVKVTLDQRTGSFIVQDLGERNEVQVGRDHDNCLAADEVYATMAVATSALRYEPSNGKTDTSNDDCERAPATTRKH